MSIGGALTEARKRAGLTITQVSQRTRIRETIIRDIERDDYSACGGDFYARGHIRAIARVIGTDPVPLIEEYDAARNPPEEPIVAGHPNGDGRSGDEGLDAASGGAGGRPGVAGITAAEAFRPAMPLRPSRRLNWTIGLVVLLVVVVALLIYLLVSGSPGGSGKAGGRSRVAASAPASARPTTSRPTGTPSPKTLLLRPVSAVAFGPAGTGQGDDPQQAGLAIDGNDSTAWHTDWYTTAGLGGLQSGTGLLLDMGNPVTVSSARVILGRTPGATVQLRAGNTPALADLPPVAQLTDAGGSVLLRPASRAPARYLLLWFTRLPPDTFGSYQASVYEIRLTGTP